MFQVARKFDGKVHRRRAVMGGNFSPFQRGGQEIPEWLKKKHFVMKGIPQEKSGHLPLISFRGLLLTLNSLNITKS